MNTEQTALIDTLKAWLGNQQKYILSLSVPRVADFKNHADPAAAMAAFIANSPRAQLAMRVMAHRAGEPGRERQAWRDANIEEIRAGWRQWEARTGKPL